MLYSTAGMPLVMVIAEDAAARVALRAELRERGVDARGAASVNDALAEIAAGALPAVVILDAASADAAHPALPALARGSALLVLASRTQPPLPRIAGAEVMFRPVSIGEIARRVEELLAGQAA